MSEGREKQYALRLPVELYAEIERWAEEDLRSVNAQIVTILRDAVRRKAERKPTENDETRYTTEDIETPELAGVAD